MVALGLLLTFLGFLISFLSVALTSSMTGRLVITLIGLAISLFGVIGVLNRAYLKNAIWKR
ncbi:MAG TPA: hypothetical protein VN737_14855 [Bryobacteraceae bacterium]|nr:hypothetical protein [Bryobacteraceae bacterium]